MTSPSRKRGRPKTGKKLNPDYTLMGGYVKKSTDTAARHFLIDNDEFRTMGELLDAAVSEFLSKRNYTRRKRGTKNNL